jgi:hypothetical protein
VTGKENSNLLHGENLYASVSSTKPRLLPLVCNRRQSIYTHLKKTLAFGQFLIG